MKPSLIRAGVLANCYLVFTGLARAHPGHDGHELTWDLGHLAQHPLATMGCAAVVGGAAGLMFHILRRRADGRSQSLRASQRSRGK